MVRDMYREEYERLRKQGWEVGDIIDFLNRVAWQRMQLDKQAPQQQQQENRARAATR